MAEGLSARLRKLVERAGQKAWAYTRKLTPYGFAWIAVGLCWLFAGFPAFAGPTTFSPTIALSALTASAIIAYAAVIAQSVGQEKSRHSQERMNRVHHLQTAAKLLQRSIEDLPEQKDRRTFQVTYPLPEPLIESIRESAHLIGSREADKAAGLAVHIGKIQGWLKRYHASDAATRQTMLTELDMAKWKKWKSEASASVMFIQGKAIGKRTDLSWEGVRDFLD